MTITNYGSIKPEDIIYYPDQVAINTDIHQESQTGPDGETQMGWVANTEYITYPEYCEQLRTEIELSEARTLTTSYELALELISGGES